jgi:hypothetical protein
MAMRGDDDAAIKLTARSKPHLLKGEIKRGRGSSVI